jgi:hypothetical protein
VIVEYGPDLLVALLALALEEIELAVSRRSVLLAVEVKVIVLPHSSMVVLQRC